MALGEGTLQVFQHPSVPLAGGGPGEGVGGGTEGRELSVTLSWKSCHWILTGCDESFMEQIKDISSSTWSLRIRESCAPESSAPVYFFSLLSLETLGINGEVMKETLNRFCFPPSPGSLSQILSASVSHSNLILDFFPLFSPPPSFSIFLHNTE